MEEQYLSKEEFFQIMEDKMNEYNNRKEIERKYIDVIKQVFEKQKEYLERSIIKPYMTEHDGKKIVAIEVSETVNKAEFEQIEKEVKFMIKMEKYLENHLS